MMKNRLLKIGLTGTVVSALCCFTPALIILFSVLGISSALAFADYILLPSLVFFLSITGYAFWKRYG